MWAKASIGTAALYYICIMFNEMWVLNCAIFVSGMILNLIRVTHSMESEELDVHWLAMIGLFHTVAYGSIAYRTEKMSKMAFLGREH